MELLRLARSCPSAVLLALPLAHTGLLRAAVPPRPNIVIILADDMGFSDLGCYGSEIATPNLDRLAAQGLRFTQFYNGSRCCPTRASLLTGLYPHQAGVGLMNTPNDHLMAYAGDLHAWTPTLAEVLRPAGYRTYMVGKWHVAAQSTLLPPGPKYNWPGHRGFDRYYGTLTGATSYFDPRTLVRGNTMISPFADPLRPAEPGGYYYTDALTDEAIRFVRDHRRDHAGQPFFLYVAYTAPHFPLQAKPTDIAKYRGRYDVGYGPIRRARFAREKRLGLVAPDVTLPPEVQPWPANRARRKWLARAMEVYAAQIDCMDQNVGRLVAALEETHQLDDTLLLFLSDNGACAEHVTAPRDEVPSVIQPRGTAAVLFEHRPVFTRDGRRVRYGFEALPGTEDTYMVYGTGWAEVSNTPFRSFKQHEFEGGISTPLIVHWPDGIPARLDGSLVRDPGHVIDFMATVMDLGGAAHPARFGGQSSPPPEGISLAPAFTGHSLVRIAPLFFEHLGNRAVRAGDWKLVADGPAGAWELYDIKVDRGERTNLSDHDPSRATTLRLTWESWAHRTQVLPWPYHPAYGASPSPP